MSGNLSASGATERVRVTQLSIPDSKGYYQTVTVDSEKVRTRYCKDECQPTVNLVVPNTPLWEKVKEDSTSIWTNADASKYEPRTIVVGKLALLTGRDSGGRYDEIHCGPDRPGQVISTLASTIEVTLPASAKQ